MQHDRFDLDEVFKNREVELREMMDVVDFINSIWYIVYWESIFPTKQEKENKDEMNGYISYCEDYVKNMSFYCVDLEILDTCNNKYMNTCINKMSEMLIEIREMYKYT